MTAPPTWPSLREELALHPGPGSAWGASTWTLQDPVANRFFRVGWAEFEILCRWHLGSEQAVAAGVNRETTLTITPDRVGRFRNFLARNHLLRPSGPGEVAQLVASQRARQGGWFKKLFHSYLFFRIPLFHPDALLTRVLPFFSWAFTPWYPVLIGLVTLTGLALLLRQWDLFLATFPHFHQWQGALLLGLAITFGKMAHECGHALTAKRFGCQVPVMGVAVMLLWPMLYTDVSETWKLPSRRQRMAVTVAGLAAEMALAAMALLAWPFLPPGPWQATAFVLATTIWTTSLLINGNPLMRFDGYYLLADFLDEPNLQERAFVLARWQLRRWVLGLTDPPPEPLPPRRHRLLILYAWIVWLYRLFLYTAIALLVYHFFFKLLGLLLFAVEIAWFFLLPLTRELLHWWRLRQRLGRGRRLLLLALLVGGGAALPGQTSLTLPAIWQSRVHTLVHVPLASQLAAIFIKPGERVVKNQPLFRFDSPELFHRLQQAGRRASLARWQLAIQGSDRETLERNQVILQEWRQAVSEQEGLVRESGRLNLAAPIDGVIMDMNESLQAGDWLAEGEALLRIVDTRQPTVTALARGEDMAGLEPGLAGVFIADGGQDEALPCRLMQVEMVNLHHLEWPVLASTHGGAIPVRLSPQGQWIPETAHYRVMWAPEPGVSSLANHFLTGTVTLQVPREGLWRRIWRRLQVVLIRESGF